MSAKFLDPVVNAVKRRAVITLFVNKHERQLYGGGLVNPVDGGEKSGGSRGSDSCRDARPGKSRRHAHGPIFIGKRGSSKGQQSCVEKVCSRWHRANIKGAASRSRTNGGNRMKKSPRRRGRMLVSSYHGDGKNRSRGMPFLSGAERRAPLGRKSFECFACFQPTRSHRHGSQIFLSPFRLSATHPRRLLGKHSREFSFGRSWGT